MGVSTPISDEVENNFEVVEASWGLSKAKGTLEKLQELNAAKGTELYGVCIWCRAHGGKYFLAIKSEETAIPFDSYSVTAATYAVFTGCGKLPQAMQELEKRIFTKWLPTSCYEYRTLRILSFTKTLTGNTRNLKFGSQ